MMSLFLQFTRSNTKSHSESQVKGHLNLALRGLETTQNQVRALVSLVEDQSQEMGRLMSKVKEQSEQIERMNMMNYAPFLWKIPNFQAVYDRAVAGEEEVILSEPFYLSKNGYKLRIKMMPNGSSIFKGHFFSLYINVVPGEYDSVLKWPFAETVRVTLIDQDPLDTGGNISRVIDFKTRNALCPRPLIENDEGCSFGALLEKDLLRTRSYIKNDTVFIMASKEG